MHVIKSCIRPMIDCSVRNMWLFWVRKINVVLYCSLLSFQCKSITAMIPRLFSGKPSVQVSQTLLSSYLSRDSSCYVSRPILAPPLLWLHKTQWSTRTKLCALSRMVTWLWLFIVTCAWTWRLCGITLAIPTCRYVSGLTSDFHEAHSCSTRSRNVRFSYVICFEFLRVTRLSQPSVNASFHKRMFLFTSWSHYVCLSQLAYRFLYYK